MGMAANATSGCKVRRIGDVNSDGLNDLLIWSCDYSHSDSPYPISGYVVFGNSSLGLDGILELSNLNGTNGFMITGIDISYQNDAGYAGDINADGVDDLIIGTPNVGFAIFGWVNLGQNAILAVSDLNGKNGFNFSFYNSNIGKSTVSYIGDFNQDGVDDFSLGTYSSACDDLGIVYVVLGGVNIGKNAAFSLNNLNGSNGFQLIAPYSQNQCPNSFFGSSVGSADVNADGINDIIMGASLANSGAGAAYVVFGGKSLANCTPDQSRQKQNKILIPIAISAGLFTLVLLYCTYKRFHRPHRENIQEHDNKSDHQSPMQDNLQDSTLVSNSLIPYQSLSDSGPYPVLSLQNYPSADDDSQEFKSTKVTSPKKPWESTISYEIPRSELQYDEKHELGHGAYGIVYQGTYKDSDVAVKKLINRPGKDALAELEKEFKVLSQVRSPYIIQLIGVSLESSTCFLVMELMPKGSLYQFLLSSPKLSLELIYRISLFMTRGVSHLHQAGVIHGDLKSLNVLLGIDYNPKLTDFGQAKMKSESTSTTGMPSTGTLGWNAPELFNEDSKTTKESDIYSLGMILWELTNQPHKRPFFGLSQAALVSAKLTRSSDKQENIPKNCPKAYAQVIRSCWQKPAKRPTADSIAKSLEKLWQIEKEKEVKNNFPKSPSIRSEPPTDYEINSYT